ncbi:MAG: serine/threonine-protein kinase [Polyangia bacterium]
MASSIGGEGSEEDESEIPSRLGRFRIIRRLARGGMAELFLARVDGAGGFEKLVVVKRMLDKFASHSEMVKMFIDEARIGGRLEHPNIVQVYDLGEEDGRFFYAMEFLQGEDVRTIFKRAVDSGHPMPLDIALAIVVGAASGLHYAHQLTQTDGDRLDLVHRDVSPHNLVITYDGGVKLVDFGIAKSRSQRSAKTQTGALKGKLAYMSPEQAQGRPVDRRTDVFSLGIVLWELLAGRRLFTGETRFAILGEVIERPIPALSEHRDDVPDALQKVLDRALCRDLTDRYPTALALREAIEQICRTMQLESSDLRLTRYMAQHFPERVSPWLEAKNTGGIALVHHFSQRHLVLVSDEDEDSEPSGEGSKPTVAPSPRGGEPAAEDALRATTPGVLHGRRAPAIGQSGRPTLVLDIKQHAHHRSQGGTDAVDDAPTQERYSPSPASFTLDLRSVPLRQWARTIVIGLVVAVLVGVGVGRLFRRMRAERRGVVAATDARPPTVDLGIRSGAALPTRAARPNMQDEPSLLAPSKSPHGERRPPTTAHPPVSKHRKPMSPHRSEPTFDPDSALPL